MSISKSEFNALLKLSGKPRTVGTDYFVENRNKIYTFRLAANGSVFNMTLGTLPSSAAEIAAARDNKNYIGVYLK